VPGDVFLPGLIDALPAARGGGFNRAGFLHLHALIRLFREPDDDGYSKHRLLLSGVCVQAESAALFALKYLANRDFIAADPSACTVYVKKLLTMIHWTQS
jgi:hypothetical protein